MAESALGIRRARSFRVARAKSRRVIVWPFGQSVIARLAPCCYLRVTNRAPADPIFVARARRFVAHRAVPHRRYAELRQRSLLSYISVTGLAGYPAISVIRQMFGVREFQVSPHHRVPRRRRRVIHVHNLSRFAARYPRIGRVHDEAADFMIVGIILLLRLVTTEAVRVFRVRSEMRFDFGVGVTLRTFFMRGESSFLGARRNRMTDVAISPSANDLRHFTLNAEVKLVRKVE